MELTNPRIEDLRGKQFGRWTVLEYEGQKKGQTTWKCQCSCENKTIRIKTSGALKSGKSKSCGCLKHDLRHPRFIDLTGQKFGRLTVIEEAPKPPGQTSAFLEMSMRMWTNSLPHGF